MPSNIQIKLITGVLIVALVATSAIGLGIAVTDQGPITNQLGDEQADEETNETDVQQTSYLRVAHTSPDAPEVDVLVENESVLTSVPFGDISEYLSLQAGTYNVSIVASEEPDTVVFDGNITLDPRTSTTLAATGEITESANTTFEPVAFNDDAVHPGDNQSAIRIVHLSPDAPAVDITVENESSVLADNVTFRNGSDYVTVPSGNYTVEIRSATETNDGEIVTTVDVTLENETAYSALAIGYLAPDDAPEETPFEVALIEDANMKISLPSDEMSDEDSGNTTDTDSEM